MVWQQACTRVFVIRWRAARGELPRDSGAPQPGGQGSQAAQKTRARCGGAARAGGKAREGRAGPGVCSRGRGRATQVAPPPRAARAAWPAAGPPVLACARARGARPAGLMGSDHGGVGRTRRGALRRVTDGGARPPGSVQAAIGMALGGDGERYARVRSIDEGMGSADGLGAAAAPNEGHT
ncbi:MAG: hypothetical protein J3K34DRAFT_416179 [Monoraphidium minutum]|nr:MAG: hypothetical protein J3K34DRAFT_416179 [Monoraphidium minutum]